MMKRNRRAEQFNQYMTGVMKLIYIVASLLFAITVHSAHAQSAQSDVQQRQLAGNWVSRASRPDGLTIGALMSLKSDGSFAGRATANGKPFMSYEGTWKLDGNRLNWIYIHSQPELPETARRDSDELLSVSEKTLVLKSSQSGEVRTYERQK